MYKNLTDTEKMNLHTYNVYRILETCRSAQLPLSVYSTSILFYRKLFDNVNDPGEFDFRLLLKAIILLACKCENIHGDFTFLINSLKKEQKEKVKEYEGMLAYRLKFDFNIPSPYLRMLGYIVVLQERGFITAKNGIQNMLSPVVNTFDMTFYEHEQKNWNGNDPIFIEDMDKLWETSVINMDKVLIAEKYHKNGIKECALAALVLPAIIYKGLIDHIDHEMVTTIRKRAKTVRLPSTEEVNQIFVKLAQ